MPLVYKVYPALLWVLCLVFWTIGAMFSVALGRVWTLFVWPIPAGVLAWFVAGLFVVRFPRIRFVNKAEIDGLGYVHQPFDVLMPFWIMSFLAALVTVLRRG